MRRSRSASAPRCRVCVNPARRDDPFCCDACRELFYRYEEKLVGRETVEMQDDERTVFVPIGPGCRQQMSLQNSA
jgi:hypothetical protein